MEMTCSHLIVIHKHIGVIKIVLVDHLGILKVLHIKIGHLLTQDQEWNILLFHMVH